MKLPRFLYLFGVFFLIFNLIGCDAFVRKFTRKPKKEDIPQEELVLVPEEYKQTMSKEELYRQYLLYWKSWQDELIEALSRRTNYKKQLSCAQQAINNLLALKPLLNEEKNKKLDVHINQVSDLRDLIRDDNYCLNIPTYKVTAERLRRAILRDFSFDKIKGSLK
jgi:hypothetical protein